MNGRRAAVPVGLSESLEPGAVRATTVDETEAVLWRQTSGAAHLWPDRCPHRGMRLSFGCVRDDRLACIYHGFRFDGGGQCRHVPADPGFTPPASMAVKPLACSERSGLLWATGEESDQLPAEPAADNYRDLVSLTVNVPAERLIAALEAWCFLPHGAAPDSGLAEPTFDSSSNRWRLADRSYECHYQRHRHGRYLLEVQAECDGTREALLVGVQPVNGAVSMLHARSSASHPEACHHHLDQLLALRWNEERRAVMTEAAGP